MSCKGDHLFLGKTKLVSECTRCGMSLAEIELAKVSEKLQAALSENEALSIRLNRTTNSDVRKTRFIVDRFSRQLDTPTGGSVYVCTDCNLERPFHSEDCPVGNLLRGR